MSYQSKKAQSAISAQSMAYLETLYEQYLSGDTEDLNHDFLKFFQKLRHGSSQAECSHRAVIEEIKRHVSSLHRGHRDHGADVRLINNIAQQVLNWYMCHGHFHAELSMCKYARLHHDVPRFSWDNLQVSADDLAIAIDCPLSVNTPKETNLSTLKAECEQLFQSKIGYEFQHIKSQAQKDWMLKQIATGMTLSAEEKRYYCRLLIQSEQLEHHLARSFIGQKRFSLEGAESFIIALEQILLESSRSGIEEVVLGMAHRGRLNTMVNTLGLPCSNIDSWFKGFTMTPEVISGDVKYHLGYSSDRRFNGQPVHITLNFNPSHLESIVPVTMGSVRARQNDCLENGKAQVMPVIVHGDASFTGQGVVAESLNMSYTEAYDVGGVVHIIINNQIGFTSTPDQARSSYYCTDFAKAIDAPVIHVNGDDPEAVIFAASLAARYRALFHQDVVVDILSYRRHGHNEADEPSATNPLTYGEIREKSSVISLYAGQLIQESVVTQDEISEMEQSIKAQIKSGERLVEVCHGVTSKREAYWKDHIADDWREATKTQISKKMIQSLASVICHVPQGFQLQKQVKMMVDARQAMYKGERNINWGAAEALAIASLLKESVTVRLVGQDCCRGTFAHRHATLHDQVTGEAYTPCSQLTSPSCLFELYNSTLSEFAALGFEYGYALSQPRSLVLWEAQFGDFANGAQVIIDQYISSAWQKWGRMCGLVLLLPHGYEGQGPEHSSARLERYLQLCAQSNIQVCVPSTPGQYFHLLRRQVLRKFRAPLIVITPKSLLRNPVAVSGQNELTEQSFNLVLDDTQVKDKSAITRVVLCSGKVYYDCLEAMNKENLSHIAICRIEQLYPFPEEELKSLLAGYVNAKTVIWCQEEPHNQGAWYVLRSRMNECLLATQTLSYAGRPKMASSAPGDLRQYSYQQKELVHAALHETQPKQ